MTRISATPSNEQSIHAALELSKNRWLLAIQVPGRNKPSLHPIKGGDGEGVRVEMVESKKIANQVFYCGVDFGQGWHFGKPDPDPYAFAHRFAAAE